MSLWSGLAIPNDPEGLLADDGSALWGDNDNPIQVD